MKTMARNLKMYQDVMLMLYFKIFVVKNTSFKEFSIA